MSLVGILGGGQLGRMLALAGLPLGLSFRFLDPDPEAPAGQLAEHVCGPYEDPDCLNRFLRGLTAVSYEFENVPVDLARRLEGHVAVYPPPAALEASQDRLAEKTLFRDLGISTAPFHPVSGRADLEEGVRRLGLPALLKTRRLGYDGKGQYLLRRPEDVAEAWRQLGGVPLLLEGFLSFERELSQIAVRGRDGQVAFYPLVENHHERGMLRLTLAPAPGLTEDLQQQACALTRRVLEAVGHVGVLTVELFQQGSRLIANEMAPRVHNSGHWTIEGAVTSQFENHLRAVVDWPLGATQARGAAAMLNLIGRAPEAPEVLAEPDAHLHLYGKLPRPGRKLGHVTVLGPDADEVRRRVERLMPRLTPLFAE